MKNILEVIEIRAKRIVLPLAWQISFVALLLVPDKLTRLTTLSRKHLQSNKGWPNFTDKVSFIYYVSKNSNIKLQKMSWGSKIDLKNPKYMKKCEI